MDRGKGKTKGGGMGGAKKTKTKAAAAAGSASQCRRQAAGPRGVGMEDLTSSKRSCWHAVLTRLPFIYSRACATSVCKSWRNLRMTEMWTELVPAAEGTPTKKEAAAFGAFPRGPWAIS